MLETTRPRNNIAEKKIRGKKSARGKKSSHARGRGDANAVTARLLAWYDTMRRPLPWRAGPGETPDPYRVWLSEIMLQQTTVAAVAPRFERFLRRWPDVGALAAAPLDDVLAEWQGLGYYARARNLHRAAQAVAGGLGGQFPDSEEALRKLPGVGAYTAGAIAAIAFGRKAAAIDANAERVIARLFAVRDALPGAKERLRGLALDLVPEARPGDFAQALMDLGATVCAPRAPRCGVCPVAKDCRARALGIAAELPRKQAKAARPTRHGVMFYVERSDGALWLRKRPEKGLLGGMIEIPSSDWRREIFAPGEAFAAAPIAARWRVLPGRVEHSFTHFHLQLTVMAARITAAKAAVLPGIWSGDDGLAGLALPTVMKKVIRHARAGLNHAHARA